MGIRQGCDLGTFYFVLQLRPFAHVYGKNSAQWPPIYLISPTMCTLWASKTTLHEQ
jgi:hypothetical protein